MLLVYWLAEEYAELLGEQAEGGQLPSRASIRGALAATWPMVSASYVPLLALVLVRLAGASSLVAANVGLAAAIVLLDHPRMVGPPGGPAAQLAAIHRHLGGRRAGTADDRAQGPGSHPPALERVP